MAIDSELLEILVSFASCERRDGVRGEASVSILDESTSL